MLEGKFLANAKVSQSQYHTLANKVQILTLIQEGLPLPWVLAKFLIFIFIKFS